MTIQVLPTSEVRNHLAEVLENLKKNGSSCLMTKNGRAIAALIPIESYDRIMSDLEDRMDETDRSLADEITQSRAEYRQSLKQRKTRKAA